jgi:ketosteroid isomerase-like protein
MKNGLLTFLAFLAVTSLFISRPTLSAMPAVDLEVAEAAVRKADANWAAVAGTVSVDAWMAFYVADAAVLLPNDQLASGTEPVRDTVTRLLALPHLSVAWRPTRVDVARSGDLAILIGAYELSFGGSRGALVSDRGRRLEIWRKQADRTWKCSVDTWTSDEPIAAPSAAPATSAQSTSPTAGSAAPLAQTAPPLSAAVPESGPPSPAGMVATKYGEMPTDYKEAIRKYFLERLRYPDSVQYREITKPEQGYVTAVAGVFLMREKREYGWTVKATINAKNSHDSYVGFKTYMFLFRGEKIVDARLPLSGDEMN